MGDTAKKSMIAEFRDFISKGNVIELAVAVVIGVAFGAVTKALVDGVIMPLTAAVAGQPNFDSLTWTVDGSKILYGTFLTALVNFLIVAAAMFMVVKSVQRMQRSRVKEKEESKPAAPSETDLLIQIRDLLASKDPRT